jgi:hypothetical protein
MEWNRESRNKSLHSWTTDFQQRYQEYAMDKLSLFNKCCLEKVISICGGIKLDPYLIPYAKINLKWAKGKKTL